MSSKGGENLDPYFQPSKLTENFARLCHLILTICSDLLRDIIGRHILPSELTNTIDKERNVLWEKFSKQQKEEIYPAHARVLKAKNFDISLCYILLRNICGIPSHAAGWGMDPEPGDYSVSACIDIIRIERNKVCAHSARGTIDQPEFQDHWNKIKEAVIHLEEKEIGGDWYVRGVDCLWSCSLSPFKNEEYIEEMKNVKSKLDGIDGCIKGLQATVGFKMACKRARLDQLEESQNATLTDISDQIEDLQKHVVEKVHRLQNYLEDIQEKVGDEDGDGEGLLSDVRDIKRRVGMSQEILDDIREKVGDEDEDGESLLSDVRVTKRIVGMSHAILDDIKDNLPCNCVEELKEGIEGLQSHFERTANDIEWNITEKIMGKMKEFEKAMYKERKLEVHPCEKGKEPTTDSCDKSGVNCSISDISNIGEEIDPSHLPRRSKSFELHCKKNERVIWVCGWEKSCWVISLCTSGNIYEGNNQYKIYRMEESAKGLKLKQELTIHEPVLQGIEIDDKGRLVYLSQSKKCVRYVTKENTIKTLHVADVDETCMPYAFCFDEQKLHIIFKRNGNFFVSENYLNKNLGILNNETEICAHLGVPRRMFKKVYEYPNTFAILNEGVTICKKNVIESHFEASVAISALSEESKHGVQDMAIVEDYILKGLLLVFSNGIHLVDWEGNYRKKVHEEIFDEIRTISVSERNLWIGHKSNTIERIDFQELDLI